MCEYVEYKKNLIDGKIYEKLYEEIKDKCIKGTTRRKSCLFALHSLNLLSSEYKLDVYECKDVPPTIKDIREVVERESKTVYDYVLVHIYLDGNASIGYHADVEAMNTPICSVSLGATRKFRLKEKGRKTGYDYQYLLESGDMILMKVGCQQRYLHCVPIEKKVLTSRINLTFRQYDTTLIF